jgi:dTDP-4-dehydrorhamnose reductase
MNVLVFGGTGFVGREVVRQALAAHDQVAATYLTRSPDAPAPAWFAVDIRDRAQVSELTARLNPDVVINAAYQQADWASRPSVRRR